jgi:DNA-binding NtrC family response regulator
MKEDVSPVSTDTMTAVMSYGWPIDVRELEHAAERASY